MKESSFLERFLKAAQMTFSGRGGNYSAGVVIDNSFTRPSLNDFVIFPGSRVDFASEVGDPAQNSLIAAAVKWLGDRLPEAPLQVLVEDQEGQAVAEPAHEVVKLLKRPNSYYAGKRLLKAFAADWIISGNVYWLKVRNRGGKVIELWPIPSCQITPRWPTDGSEFVSHYEYRVDDRTIRLEQSDVIHFRDGFNQANPRLGYSPVSALLRELYSDNEAANFSAALLKNFGVPGLIISPADANSTIDPEQASFLKGEIARRTTGDERGRPFVAGGPIRVERLSFDPDKLDLRMLRRLPEERVAAALGIPAVVLGYGAGLERSIFNNVREAREEAFESYLCPLLAYICDELDAQLLPEFDQRTNVRTAFDLSNVRVLQEDQDALYKRLVDAYKSGMLKRSEVRSKLGFVVGPEDEVYYQAPATPAPDAGQPAPSGISQA